MFVKLFKFFLLIHLSLACSVAFSAQSSDPNPQNGDVVVPIPCNESMVFRKVYTGTRSRATRSFLDQPATQRICTVQGTFEDHQGFYFLLSKYELTEYQYKILTEAKCPTFNRKLSLPAVGYTKQELESAALNFSEFLQQAENVPAQNGVKAIASLPMECDWAFALRGGMEVSEDQLHDKNALTTHKAQSLRDLAWFQGSNSSNGKLNLVGKLKPNVLGFYDLLGNAQEIMSDSLHGGNITVRGGGFLTPDKDLNNELRFEKPLFSRSGGVTKAKDLGTRFELSVPYFTSVKELDRKETLEKLKNEDENQVRAKFGHNRTIVAELPPQVPANTNSSEKQTKPAEATNHEISQEALEHFKVGKTLYEKQKFEKAKVQFETACDLNHGDGCVALGKLYSKGQGVKQNYQQAKKFYEKACELNEGRGCSNLGVHYANGQGVKQDYNQAKTFYEKACELNDGMGCSNLGVHYANGQGVRQNYRQAKEFYGKACDLGFQYGCDKYAELNKKGY